MHDGFPRLLNEDQIQSRASPWHESAMEDRESNIVPKYCLVFANCKIEVAHGLIWKMILIGTPVQNFVFVI